MDLTDFDGAHADEDVWLVGSDASVGMFPEGFWNERTVVGVNMVARHIPCRYCVTKADNDSDSSWVQKQAAEVPQTVHVVSKYPNGDHRRPEAGVTGPNVVVFDHWTNKVDRFDASFDVPDDERKLLVSWSTLGSAMHFAARLGARTVFMVGVSGGSFGDATNLPDYNPNGAGPIEGMSRQTQPIANRLRAMYGTEFVTVLPWANLRCGGTKFRSDYGRLNDA